VKVLSNVTTMADSSLSSASTTSTACGGGTAAITIDEMHGLLKEFRAVYESRLLCLDAAEPCEDTQKVVRRRGRVTAKTNKLNYWCE